MRLPVPKPGFVIRYAYLWYAEYRAGREESAKDRPCAVVLTTKAQSGSTAVTVLPITHVEPADLSTAIEVPRDVKRRLGLDDDRSWIVFSEANRFRWPGPDVRFVRGGQGMAAYGPLPPKFFHAVLKRFVAALEVRKARYVDRTE